MRRLNIWYLLDILSMNAQTKWTIRYHPSTAIVEPVLAPTRLKHVSKHHGEDKQIFGARNTKIRRLSVCINASQGRFRPKAIQR